MSIPKRGSVADLKRQSAFEDRTISLGNAILEGVAFSAMFAGFVILCAVA